MSTTRLTLQRLLPLFTFLAIALTASSAWAFKYCVRARMDISNNLPPPAQDWPGYDGTDFVTHWRMDGVRMRIEKKDNNGVWVDRTGWQWSDGDACVDVDASVGAGYYRARIQSRGRPMNSWQVTVTDTDDPGDYLQYIDSTVGHYINQIGYTYSHTFDISYSSDLLRIYTVIANVAHERFNGGLEGNAIQVQRVLAGTAEEDTVCDDSDDSKVCSVGGVIKAQIREAHAHSKQLIAHEWGHVIHHRAIAERSGGPWANDYSYYSDDVHCRWGEGDPEDPNFEASKNLRSQEWTSATMTEGFADFVSFDAWNVHDGSDSNPPAYYWYKVPDADPPTDKLVNMEYGEFAYEEQYCRTKCDSGPGCEAGTGVMLDWERLLWDFHTNNYGGQGQGDRQTHSDMLDAARIGWGKDDAWPRILLGLSGDDSVRWDTLSTANGIP